MLTNTRTSTPAEQSVKWSSKKTTAAALLIAAASSALGAVGAIALTQRRHPIVPLSWPGYAAQFERWSHFKDYGIPGTVHDPLNRAAIADGSCRLLGSTFGGFALWRNQTRVAAVLTALAAAPSTAAPSHFTLRSFALLTAACPTNQSSTLAASANFTVAQRAASLQNWYHAVCAPEDDPSWSGVFDPANQPQQITLTVGFMCIVTCELHRVPLSAEAMQLLWDSATTHAALCSALPWAHGTPAVDFTTAKDESTLAELAQPLRQSYHGEAATCAC